MNLKLIKSISLIFVILIFLTSIITFAQSFEVYYAQGLSYFNVGNYKASEEYLKRALTLQPSLENTSNIKMLIGLSAMYSGDYVTAKAYLPADFLTSSYGTSLKTQNKDIVSQISNWEINPLLQSYQPKHAHKNTSNSQILTIFLFMFIPISGMAITYIFFKRKKSILKASSLFVDDSKDEMEDIFVKNQKDQQILTDIPKDIISDAEIEKRLNKALEVKNEPSHKEKTTVILEPTKVVEKTNQDPSEEELAALAQAIQEILSKESEKEDK